MRDSVFGLASNINSIYLCVYVYECSISNEIHRKTYLFRMLLYLVCENYVIAEFGMHFIELVL